MAQRPQLTPSYRLHKASGQAFVRLNGRNHYLGKHDSPESRAKYDCVLSEWLAAGRKLCEPVPTNAYTVALLADDFVTWAEHEYRRPDGQVSRSVDNLVYALRPLLEMFFDAPAASFGPRSLVLYRERLIRDDLCRKIVNERVGIVKRAFKWATREERIPPSVFQGLSTVDGLRRGRCGARESARVQCVPQKDIDAALPNMPPMVRAMAQLQLLTGARPGELVVLRMCDVDTSSPVWLFRPVDHKNAWREQDRSIPLGPRCQDILRPFIRPGCAARYLFSPSESERARRAQLRAQRKTPLWPSHLKALDRKRRSAPRTTPRDRYDVVTYARAIRRACERAEIDVWSPGQLRHNAATNYRREFGLDAASAMLGHRKVETTQIYAEANVARQLEIASKVG